MTATSRQQSTPPPPLSSVGARRVGPTSLSVQRREGRAAAARILDAALANHSAVALRVGTSADAVDHWCDGTQAPALGDVLAMSADDAERVLDAALALVRARRARPVAMPPAQRGCVIAKETGEAVLALATRSPACRRELLEAREAIDAALASEDTLTP